MKEHSPKTTGVTYLRYAVNKVKSRPNAKFVTIPMSKAKEIIEQANDFTPRQSCYDPKRNSERAAALILGIDVKELCERLNHPSPSKLLNDLAEARNRVASLSRIGDKLSLQSNNNSTIQDWQNARKL